jgi:tetratricopeptide (TPR) repeat protein
VRSIYISLIASLFLIVPPVCAANGATSPFRTTSGIISDGEQNGSRIWFDLTRIDQRFIVYGVDTVTAGEVMKILKDSSSTSKSVSVHYFLDGASFVTGSPKPTYIVHDLTYDDRTIQLLQTLPPADPNAVQTAHDVAAGNLAMGIALAGDADTSEALRALGLALDGNALDAPLKALALKTRSSINEDAALANFPPGQERDKLLVAALNDARAWAAISQTDSHAATAVARDLSSLGAFDEATDAFKSISKKWPEDDFWSQIGIVTIQRHRGEYDAALAVLDDIAKHGSEQLGMAYYFHRGLTLSEAGRYADAVTTFNEGFKSQPDYGVAFFERACANAKLGRLKEAIADQEAYIKAMSAYGSDTPPGAGVAHDQQRMPAALAGLKAAYAQNPNQPGDAACTGYWDWGESKRERSSLLPPSADPRALLP